MPARLSGSMAAFQQGRSPKLIADTRRQRRRLAQLGPVKFVNGPGGHPQGFVHDGTPEGALDA